MPWTISLLAFVSLMSANSVSAQAADDPCLSAHGCEHEGGFYDPNDDFDLWLNDYLLGFGGGLDQCTGGFSPDYSCPGETPEQCRQRCDQFAEQLWAGCRALYASNLQKLICWQRANEEYSRCLAAC